MIKSDRWKNVWEDVFEFWTQTQTQSRSVFPSSLTGPIGSLARVAKTIYLPASRSWTSICKHRYQSNTCSRRFVVTGVGFLCEPSTSLRYLVSLVQLVRLLSPPCKSQTTKIPASRLGAGCNGSRFCTTCDSVCSSIRRKLGLHEFNCQFWASVCC